MENAFNSIDQKPGKHFKFKNGSKQTNGTVQNLKVPQILKQLKMLKLMNFGKKYLNSEWKFKNYRNFKHVSNSEFQKYPETEVIDFGKNPNFESSQTWQELQFVI